jgi:ABC-type multidrug transport system fused ATPase/permease subunit
VTTSNRWATGRFADRIVVMKDGAIVETGTHAELLNRGPQLSIYAAKWHAMTNS